MGSVGQFGCLMGGCRGEVGIRLGREGGVSAVGWVVEGDWCFRGRPVLAEMLVRLIDCSRFGCPGVRVVTCDCQGDGGLVGMWWNLVWFGCFGLVNRSLVVFWAEGSGGCGREGRDSADECGSVWGWMIFGEDGQI